MKKITALICAMILAANISFSYGQDIEIKGKAALLMEEETGKILYEKNIKEVFPPASITKLMTYLVTMDEIQKGKISLEDEVIISERASKERGASYHLVSFEKIKLKELIEVMMIVSANDAAFAISEHVGGSMENFVNMMNQKAKDIGLEDTHFDNPNGMPQKDGGNLMTAKDIASLGKYIIDHHKEILSLTDQEFYENPMRDFYKENTNKLLKIIPQVDGLKTGYTDAAGYCLASSMQVHKNSEDEKDFRLIAVVLGTDSEEARFRESKKLLEYGSEGFVKKRIVKKNEKIKTIHLWGEKKLPITLLAKEDIWTLGPKEKIGKNREILLVKKMPYPISKGQKIGELKVTTYDGKMIKTDLVSDRDIRKLSFKLFITNFFHIFASVFSNMW
ncbi:D-alanyl-D-alanine carboxypeptidase family protein [Inediibacterium massiliense]|uniref:D-alanyl-D-alanine carboxypeptidase family protein n=1 Tax=Inediibacterium massiliense TaxID=1658111 RepID=UPI0006B541E5|nr:D-alanyl-D-alanine carboxypeptidase family protein [Inediibacterium massiliense]